MTVQIAARPRVEGRTPRHQAVIALLLAENLVPRTLARYRHRCCAQSVLSSLPDRSIRLEGAAHAPVPAQRAVGLALVHNTADSSAATAITSAEARSRQLVGMVTFAMAGVTEPTGAASWTDTAGSSTSAEDAQWANGSLPFCNS